MNLFKRTGEQQDVNVGGGKRWLADILHRERIGKTVATWEHRAILER